MSCSHEEATLLWLYGEGDEAHAEHVAGCAICTVIASEHADVVAAVGPIAYRLEDPALHETLEPANQPFRLADLVGWVGGAGVVALIAAAFLVMFLPASGVVEEPPGETEVAVLDADSLFTLDDLDFDLDDLDDALDDLEDDLFTL